MEAARPQQRVDKWLFCARFFKTRALAAALASKGRIRVNGTKISKPAYSVGPGDVLTFPQGNEVRVIRVLGPAERRGPASEARTLYEDLDPRPSPQEDGGEAAPVTEQP